MHRRALTVLSVLAAAPLVASLAATPSYAAPGGGAGRHHHTPAPYTFAVIGDVPYGDAAQAHFPTFIAGINDDPDVAAVTHLGDIKSGSTTCDDARFAEVRRDFGLFTDPLHYTPGDNEWTDCHRANNGAYQPLERLAKVRQLFFARPDRTLGASRPVTSQARRGVPENQRWVAGGLSFATLHVVGSNDDLNPWTGIGNTTATPEQVREEHHRMAAAIANVRAAYADARRHHRRAVVLMQQADMFDPTVTDPQASDYSAFKPLVQALVTESRRFDGATYLFNGDSHRFNQDRPLAAGSPWLAFYGVKGSSDDLRRVTVDGSDRGETDWLKVRTVPAQRPHRASDPVLSFEQVPGR
ncbi:hypothetical protein GCM10027596_13750 [Nocardioides korecus]